MSKRVTCLNMDKHIIIAIVMIVIIDNCGAHSMASIAETRHGTPSFLFSVFRALHFMRWFPVVFLVDGVFAVVTRVQDSNSTHAL